MKTGQNLPLASFPIYSSTLLVILSSWGAVTYHLEILRTCMQHLLQSTFIVINTLHTEIIYLSLFINADIKFICLRSKCLARPRVCQWPDLHG